MIFKLSLFFHLIAAIFWVGGMLFLVLVVAPFLKTMKEEQRLEVYRVVGTNYRFWGWIAIAILLITGPVNLYYLGITPDMLFDPAFHKSPFGKTVDIKISFVLLTVITSVVHDFWLGPNARLSRGYALSAMIFGRGNLVLALIIIILAVLVRAGGL